MNHDRSRKKPLVNFLFLDILFDRRTRPIYFYMMTIIVGGAAMYHWLEGWSWLDAVYFVVITLTTIGYGDLVPTQPVTKILTIFFSLNGLIVIGFVFDIVRRLRGWSIDNVAPSD